MIIATCFNQFSFYGFTPTIDIEPVKIDADDNKILEAAKKIIIDYIATEEFANKLKEILK